MVDKDKDLCRSNNQFHTSLCYCFLFCIAAKMRRKDDKKKRDGKNRKIVDNEN